LKIVLLREALGRIFRKRADFLVVGGRGSEGLSLEQVSETECDVMVLDFLDARWLPINLGSKASNCPEPKLLLISVNNDPDEFLKAVRRGCDRFFVEGSFRVGGAGSRAVDLRWRGGLPGRTVRTSLPAPPSKCQAHACPADDKATRPDIPAAAVGLPGGQRLDEQGNCIAAEYFRVYGQKSSPTNHETS
jgi:hypothetical protein